MKYLNLLLFIMATIIISCSASSVANDKDKSPQIKSLGYDCDSFTTPEDRQVDIYFIKHASLVLDIDGLRIYVAGDTEDIPELSNLEDIDIAFLPVNQPYTMTPQQAIHATEMFNPKILYPYHYGDTDLTPLVSNFKDSTTTEVRVKQMQ